VSILQGIVRLARFQIDGFAFFAATSQAVLSGLAPWLAIALVGCVVGVANGQVALAAANFLTTVVALLAPLVITHALARHWGRQAEWPRFAAASIWCQWVLPMAALVVLLAITVLDGMGLPENLLLLAGLLTFVGYGIAQRWFLARHGLGISRLRAVALVLVADLGTGMLILIPRLLAGDLP
jgi:hypothetical protein